MGEDLLTGLSIENYHPSTVLSMDSIATSHEESERDMTRHIVLSCPPDINLPLSVEPSPPPPSWNHEAFDMLEVGLGPQINDSDKLLDIPKVGRKCAKRLDCVWGAWFFFSFYFKPVLKEKSKSNIVRDSNGVSGFDKSDLQLDAFLVQHDMENMYMWVFKERPENALGKMQLRNYMNGHSRQGERPFPFSTDKGFVRSHKMQRKHYKGISNPQCLHGIELVPSPNLSCIDEEERKKWMELTGRDLNFCVAPEARDFSSWRNLPNTDFELERPIPAPKNNAHPPSKKLLSGSGMNLSTQSSNHVNSNGLDLSSGCGKKRKDLFSHGSDEECYLPAIPSSERPQDADVHSIERPWMSEFSGVMRNVYGPVTAAKTIYEDENGYLIIITLPFADPGRVKVHWWNNLTHGVVKISSVSTACMPFIQRNDRMFKLTDPSPEHCPPGEFKREIPLPTRIPDDAKLEAYFDKSGTVLEIKVPKHRVGPEEHEVPVCLRPPNEFVLT
ncbi:uncharacterized protein LOC116016972 [Ipomoea triloba]|uniref:uncharacterized protein LOC116016972 n=1 Tax=Ipomoea triloba TaxID=35885 RepID=UPI00125E094D|nr:uncharacterized protein LOC116016972 [Ipomoea triloba]GLL43027.1 uncharacterized protein LOC109193156 [Ipomoea trifida]GMD06861.1 Ataxin-7-like protein [Ipomoea batatas]GMD67126.1 Ataxin-7-like protein [Ipomoea batatas]